MRGRITTRLPFRPTEAQARLLMRYFDTTLNCAIADEPPFSFSKAEWKRIRLLIERLNLALATIGN